MRGARIAFFIFLALGAFVVGGVAVGPSLNAAFGAGAEGSAISVGLAAFGLAWIFALWGSLVAIMVFLILWVGASLPAEDEARVQGDTAAASPPRGAIAPQASAAADRRAA